MVNPFPPRAAKNGHFVILLCLTPDDCIPQRRAPVWLRVKHIFLIKPEGLLITIVSILTP